MTDEEYYRIYTDCWRLFRKYMHPVSADEYWQRFLDDVREIHDRYQNEFCKDLLLNIMDEVDRIYRRKKK